MRDDLTQKRQPQGGRAKPEGGEMGASEGQKREGVSNWKERNGKDREGAGKAHRRKSVGDVWGRSGRSETPPKKIRCVSVSVSVSGRSGTNAVPGRITITTPVGGKPPVSPPPKPLPD